MRRRVVRLSGSVTGAEQRRLALRLAADVPDAVGVEESLRTVPNGEKSASGHGSS